MKTKPFYGVTAVIAPRLKRWANPITKVSIFIMLFTLSQTESSAQCVAPTLTFNSPSLLSGTPGTVGAVYLFANVIPGVDCHVEIMGIEGGAGLTDIDATDQGYYDAFQPYIWAAGGDTSFLDWKFTFKKAGTYTDTTLACLAVTAIDVDGNNVDLKEFVEAATPGSFAVDPFTNLLVSFDGVRSRAEGLIAVIPLIDTTQKQAMFQMNFTNINSLLYRNGAIAFGGAMTRHTCIYFAPFFADWIVLPVKLLSFTAQQGLNGTSLKWTATNEQNIKNYTLQKSVDGKNWKDVRTTGTGASTNVNAYAITDLEKNSGAVYYRLKQTDTRGVATYSKVIHLGNSIDATNDISHNTIFTNAINMQIQSNIANEYLLEVYNQNGQRLAQSRLIIKQGTNNTSLQVPSNTSTGMYLLTIKDSSGKLLYRSKIMKD